MTTEIKYHTKEEALQAVNENGGNLEFCSKKLQNDEDVVMVAIKQNSWAFEYASDDLKSNKSFAIKALNEGINPNGLLHHSTIIINDEDVVMMAIKKDSWAFSYASEALRSNKAFVIKALNEGIHPNGLLHHSTIIINDEDVVMMAIKKDSWNFSYASEALRSNKAFVIKALNEGIHPNGLLHHSTIIIKSDIEVVTLALEKSNEGSVFMLALGEAALNKELAAKALVKWGAKWGASDLGLWKNLHLTIQEFFPKDSWYEKAQSYLYQLEQEKQAEMVLGGTKEEDGVVW